MRPSVLTAVRAAARHAWDWVRRRRQHTCQWHGRIRCDAVLGPNDPPVCPVHDWLPASKQRFLRRTKPRTEQ